MNRMTSIQPMQNYTRSPKSMRNCIGWPPSDVELDREKLSTKVNEANQTIGSLRFENNFLAERTKKLEEKLFQVRA